MNNLMQHDENEINLPSFKERAQFLIEQFGRMVIKSKDDFASAGDLIKIARTDLKKMEEHKLETTKKPREYVSWVNSEFKKMTDPLRVGMEVARKNATSWADEQEKIRRIEQEKIRKAAEDKALEEAQKIEAEQRKKHEAQEAAEREAKRKAEEGDLAASQKAEQEAAKLAFENQELDEKKEDLINKTADMPETDPTIKKARGNYGSTTGVAKKYKASITKLTDLPENYLNVIRHDEKCILAMNKAISAMAIAEFKATKKDIPGIVVYQESTLNVR